jgi:glucan biosynthesis protein
MIGLPSIRDQVEPVMRVVRKRCRYLLLAVLWCIAGQMKCLGRGAPSFSFDTLRRQAADAAAEPYHVPPDNLPDYLKKLSYDNYKMIRFIPAKGPWEAGKVPFTLQFFHPGWLYRDQVLIHVIENEQVKDCQFSPADFQYGTNRFPPGFISRACAFSIRSTNRRSRMR